MLSFCKDSLPQSGSYLLKVQAAVVSPHSHGEKVKLAKNITKNPPLVNQQAFTDSGSLHAGLGAAGRSTGLVLQRSGAMRERWLAMEMRGRGPGRGDVSTKSGGGEVCPSEPSTKALWFPPTPPKSQLVECWSAIRKQKTKTWYVVFDAFCGVNTPTWPLSSYQSDVMVRWADEDDSYSRELVGTGLRCPLVHCLLFPGTHGGCGQGLDAQGRAGVPFRRAQG